VAVAAIAVCLLASLPLVYGVSAEDATAAVASANRALQAAFVTVSDAEKAGANVSGFIARLDGAGNELTSAQAALDAGDYSEAVSLAASVKGLADALAVDAGALRNDALAHASRWWVTVLVSVVGSASLAVVLLFLWRRYKRFYRDKLLGRVPEVVG